MYKQRTNPKRKPLAIRKPKQLWLPTLAPAKTTRREVTEL